MVGRHSELAALNAALAATERGSGRVVVIEGEAGIGKTRLVETWSAGAIERGARILAGGCPPLVEDLPYAPVVEILRRLVEPDSIVPTDDRGKFFGQVADVISDTTRPTVLVIEDLHWADRSTCALVAYLLSALRDDPVLLLLTVRSDDINSRHPVASLLAELTRNRRARRLVLQPLSEVEVGQLVARILGVPPEPEALEAIYNRGDGNPFFTEELVAAAPGVGRLPSTVRDVVFTRLTDLRPFTRDVLSAAAVLGRPTDHDLLAAVTGIDPGTLDAGLREALERSLLLSVDDRYAFRHQLVQETLYESLLVGERVQLHARAAAALDARHAGETGRSSALHVAEVAHHYGAAGDKAAALAASARAALAAKAAAAPAEAHAQYERALRLWPDVADAQKRVGLTLVDLQIAAAAAASETGSNARAVDLVSSALRATDRDADPVNAAALLEQRGRYAWLSAASDEAWHSYEEAGRLVKGRPASVERARVLAGIAQSLMLRSRREEAMALAREAIEDATALGATAVIGHASNTLGTSLADLGHIDEGLSLLRNALALAVDAEDSIEIGRAYHNLAESLAANGRLEEALEEGLRGERVARQLGQTRVWAPAIAGSTVHVLLRMGRLDEAAAAAELAIDSAGEPLAARVIEIWLAALEIRRGRLEVADAILERLGSAFAADDVQYHAAVARWDAELEIGRRSWEASGAAVAAALSLPGVDLQGSTGAALCALGVRAIVEKVEEERRLGRRFDSDGAKKQADNFVDRAEAILTRIEDRGGEPSSDRRGYALLARAESSRLDAEAPAAPWAEFVRDRDAAGDPYLAAYGRLRAAEALLSSRAPRQRAAPLLMDAHRLAGDMGAAQLLAEIEGLARRAGVDLVPPTPPPDAEDPQSLRAVFGLTEREDQVLALLARGMTNGEIARALFISTKTASVHVSAILRKLGVASRIQAAAIAHRS